jgi:hypothetical protein
MGELLQSVAWQIKVNRSEVFQANFHAQWPWKCKYKKMQIPHKYLKIVLCLYIY